MASFDRWHESASRTHNGLHKRSNQHESSWTELRSRHLAIMIYTCDVPRSSGNGAMRVWFCPNVIMSRRRHKRGFGGFDWVVRRDYGPSERPLPISHSAHPQNISHQAEKAGLFTAACNLGSRPLALGDPARLLVSVSAMARQSGAKRTSAADGRC